MIKGWEEKITKDRPRRPFDYAHSASLEVEKPMTAIEAYKRIADGTPAFADALFTLRDKLGRLFGLAPIGFLKGSETRRNGALTKLDFFDVIEAEESFLLLVASDHHLDSYLAISSAAHGDGCEISISSRVLCKNPIGKLYMIPVRPIHEMLVRNALDRLKTQDKNVAV